MNTIACGNCIHFNNQGVGSAQGTRDARYAWCAKKSVYPAEGMPLPPDAQTTEAPRSQPYIVLRRKIIATCTDARTA